MAKYTKDWHQEWYDHKALRIYDADGVLVATLNSSHPDFYANARLVSQSPKLYEALKAWENFWDLQPKNKWFLDGVMHGLPPITQTQEVIAIVEEK